MYLLLLKLIQFLTGNNNWVSFKHGQDQRRIHLHNEINTTWRPHNVINNLNKL